MNLFELIRTAFESLAAHKLRSGLSILGIMIGVAAIVAIVAILEGATAAVQSEFLEFLNPRLITVKQGAFFEPNVFELRSSISAFEQVDEEQGKAYAKVGKLFTAEFARELQERAPALRQVVPIVETQVLLSQGHQQITVQVIATMPEYAELLNLNLMGGRFLRSEDLSRARAVIVLSESAARDLFPRRDPLGQSVGLQTLMMAEPGVSAAELAQPRTFIVVGVLRETRLDQPRAYIPIKVLKPSEVSISRYLAEAARLEWVEEAAKQLRFILARRLDVPAVAVDDWVRTPRQEIESFQDVRRILMLVLGGIAGISLLVGGIGIMNIMLVSVTERTREIGIRKAVGARRRDILVQFLVESVCMSLTGGLLGLVLGWMLSYFGSQMGQWAFVFSLLPAVIAIGFSMVLGLFFGIYPALKAAWLMPVEALRYE